MTGPMTTQSPDATEQVTEAMIEAARGVADGVDDTAFARIYRAMRAALPSNATTNASLVEALERIAATVWVDQGMGHGHFRPALSSSEAQTVAAMALATLRASNPDEEGI